MAGLTLLQIVQTVTAELGLVQPDSVVGSSDLQTLQLYALVNREGNGLRRTHDWTPLQNLFTLNVGNPLETTGTITEGSAVITAIPTTAAITEGIFVVSGSYIPSAARVLSVDSGTQVTMDMVATGDATATDLLFSQDTYPGPTDYDFQINRTSWDRTNRWELIGPDSPQLDEWHRSGIVTTGPRRHFRFVGNNPDGNYRLWPPPQTEDTPFQIAWEYSSLNWAQSVAGVGKSSMTVDTDTTILDGQAIVLGVKWRFFQIKQFDYAPMQAEYLDYVRALIARDGGAPTLSMRRGAKSIYLSPANIQDGYFPGPTGPNTG